MKKITIVIIALIIVGMLIPAGFSTDSNIVIIYGETTNANSNYKSNVDSFFKSQANVDINNIETKIISADQVNKISSSISGKTYTSDQILSSALLNLNDNADLKVSVDKSKITTITGEMYISALKSAGITKGHVYVTSPMQASGESALAGIMNAYEEVTDVKIPDNVKAAANDEIYTQSEIVQNSGVNASDLSNLVKQVKDEVSRDNVTNHDSIVNIINNHVQNNNINISGNDIENLADSIGQVQNVQGDANNYKDKVSGILNSTSNSGFSLDSVFNIFKSFLNGI